MFRLAVTVQKKAVEQIHFRSKKTAQKGLGGISEAETQS